MRNHIPVLAAAVMLASLAATDAGEPLDQHPLVRSNVELLDSWIESQMAYRAIPGMCVGIVHDQQVVYARGFGYADIRAGRKTTPATLYRIASHSKLFTAIAIMQLRDAGKVNLDDPVKTYLPWFELQGEDPNQPPISIRHLLTHSAGVPREAGLPYWTTFKFPTTEQIIERLPTQNVVFPTETKWKYSNLAFALLGEVVAAVSGQPFEDYVHQNILRPLGMSHSGITLDSIDTEQMAKGYGRRLPDESREELPIVDAKGMAAAAGLTSSVADMTRFVSWQFRLLESDATEVLQATTLREMQRVHWLDPQWKDGWGLTFKIIKTDDRLLVGHNGGYPGFQTATFISPSEKIAVIVFSNALDAQPYPGDPLSVIDRAFSWVGDAITQAKDDTTGVEQPKARWKRFTGNYRSIWSDIRVQGLDGELVALDITHADPKATVSVLQAIGDSQTRFRVTDGNPMFPLGEIVVFELREDGRAERMMFGQVEFKRLQ